MARFKKPQHGDLFSLEFREMFLFGRVLFSIDGQYDKIVPLTMRRFDNGMDYAPKDTYLVEIYDGLYASAALSEKRKVAVPRAWIIVDGRNQSGWTIIGHEQIEPEKVEFPEGVVRVSQGPKEDYYLQRGELRYLLSDYDVAENDVFGNAMNIDMFVYLCLNVMGKSDLIEEEYDYLRALTLAENDLLYRPALREKIYRDIGIDKDKPYHQLAQEQGRDLARFYKN